MAPITRWRHEPSTHRWILRRKRWITAALQGSGLHTLLEAVWTPNRAFEITRHTIAAPVPRPVRIALVADLHVVKAGARERRLLELLEAERPDAIVLNGDFSALGGAADACGAVIERMHAPLGVWATLGNWDYRHPVGDWREFLARRGARLLVNEAAPLVASSRGDVWLAGLDDALDGMPDADLALAAVPRGAYVIGVVHCPVLFDDVADRFPLVLAGHTHGGQIRIPGLPPLYMPHGCRPYVSGWYERQGSRMYVSRGVGSPSLPVRVACAPELAMFELEPLVADTVGNDAPTDKAAVVGSLRPTGPR